METPSQNPPENTWQADKEAWAAMVKRALPLWGWRAGEGCVKLIHISENASFAISPTDSKPTGVLRLHRPHYQTRASIQSELDWLGALHSHFGEEAFFPHVILGVNGEAIQTLPASPDTPPAQSYLAVMFAFIKGDTPQPNQPRDTLIALFQKLGAMAARLHAHSENWQPPTHFTRLRWDVAGIYGRHKHWGDWRAAPNVTDAVRAVLEEAEAQVRRRLASYGTAKHCWGLIHADMRLANLLLQKPSKDKTDDRMYLIDFDDCGFGWFMYDCAASLSFIEDTPLLPQLKTAWLSGYRRWREVRADDEAMLDTFIMLRRMLLLAWLGSHPQADIAPDLSPDFAATTAHLAQRYLRGGLG